MCLQAELQQLQEQQAHLLQVSQSVRSLLAQPDSSIPPEEKQRLRAQLDRLQSEHQERLQRCQDQLRRADALQDELAKFLQEHGDLAAWLELSEGQLRSLGEGETDAQGLKERLEEHKKVLTVLCDIYTTSAMCMTSSGTTLFKSWSLLYFSRYCNYPGNGVYGLYLVICLVAIDLMSSQTSS